MWHYWTEALGCGEVNGMHTFFTSNKVKRNSALHYNNKNVPLFTDATQ